MKLNILFIPTTNSGVQYYRMHNYTVGMYRTGIANAHHLWWQKKLENMHPWQFDIHKTEHLWRITKEMQDWALKADVIVIQMLHTYAGLEIFRALKEVLAQRGLNTPIVSEIDDHMTSTPVYNAADEYYVPGSEMREVALKQFSESDAMIVSTPYLKEVYSEYNDNIHVVPNAIDFEIWDKVKPKAKPGIRIGWAGGSNHDEDLRILEPVIKNVMKKHKDVRFVLVHGIPNFLKGFHGVEYVKKWTWMDKYPQFISSLDFDIGVAPLVDNAFNRGKSNLRWLEYSALGIPTVASKVGHFAETINHGVDGFLAEDDEFENYLEMLITDKKLRNEMGNNANQRVRFDFNVDEVSKHYNLVLSHIIENKDSLVPEGVRIA